MIPSSIQKKSPARRRRGTGSVRQRRRTRTTWTEPQDSTAGHNRQRGLPPVDSAHQGVINCPANQPGHQPPRVAHPERRRDRPCEASATSAGGVDRRRKVPTPAEGAAKLHVFWKMRDDKRCRRAASSSRRGRCALWDIHYESWGAPGTRGASMDRSGPRSLRISGRARYKRALVYDGAMGTSLQARRPTTEGFGGRTHEGSQDHLVISKPVIVERVHRSFLEVGADATKQLTNSSPNKRRRQSLLITRRRSTSAWVQAEWRSCWSPKSPLPVGESARGAARRGVCLLRHPHPYPLPFRERGQFPLPGGERARVRGVRQRSLVWS